MSDRAPNYVSARSAGIILSEIRPTKINPEALLFINILLDEIVWLLLNTARSLSTDLLKSDALLKILPTALGKEALLEAEVELRAYWDRTDPTGRGAAEASEPRSKDFPLQAAFDLMRQKCQVYCTLGDLEEDLEAEVALQEKLLRGPNPPRASTLAPAALYLTAILEQICEHVLSNVAKVVARDSSRTTAHLQDLYVSLCEDDAIYPMFKRMKVKEQIELQSKASQPRRSKSISNRSLDPTVPLRSSTSSPQPSLQKSDSANGSNGTKPRGSGDSSGGNANSSSARGSLEKGRALKLFGGSDNQVPLGPPSHLRSESVLSEGTRRAMVAFQDDAAESPNDFDELMRSGTTMKVSLTPDRLKTFEVFTKEKHQKANKPNPTPAPTFPTSDIPLPTKPTPSTTVVVRRSSRNNFQARPARVESIEEDEEPAVSEAGVLKPRSRTQSLAQFLSEEPPRQPAPASSSTTAPPRSRTQTITPISSTIPSSSSVKSSPIMNKAAKGRFLSAASASNPPSSFPGPKSLPVSPAKISRATGRARNRESIDLDDLLDDDDDEEEALIVKKPNRSGLQAKEAPAANSSKDLLDFLSEGPPTPPPSQPVLPSPKPKSTSRFGRMVSRLARSGSTDHLHSLGKKAVSSAEDLSKSTPSLSGSFRSGVGLLSKPPVSYSRKGSPVLPSKAAGTPPTPPPVPHVTSQLASQPFTQPITRVRTESSASKRVAQSTPVGSRPSSAKGKLEQNKTSYHLRPSSAKDASSESKSMGSDYSDLFPPRKESLVSMTNQRLPLPAYPSSTMDDTSSRSVSPIPDRSREPSVAANGDTSSPGPAKSSSPQLRKDSAASSPPIPQASEDAAPRTTQVSNGRSPALETVSINQANELRSVLARATNVDESRIIVEMFLAKWGLPRTGNEPDIPVSINPVLAEAELAHQPDMIETLLADVTVPTSYCQSEDNNTEEDVPHPKTPQEGSCVLPHILSKPSTPYQYNPVKPSVTTSPGIFTPLVV